MKTEPGALDIAENEFGSAKHENWTRRSRYSRKRVRERKTLKLDSVPSKPPKIGPGVQIMNSTLGALGTVENKSRSTKQKLDPAPSVLMKMILGAQNMKTGHGFPRYHPKCVRERETLK
jgi:hypothetical protein